MSADALELTALVERYRSLGAADRRAVRRKLSPANFEALERACIEADRLQRAEQAPERQFKGYSPWLAGLIKQALGNDHTRPEVTAECRAAIGSAHLSTLDDEGRETLVARIGRLLGIADGNGDAAGAR